jgi:hypothetical protein
MCYAPIANPCRRIPYIVTRKGDPSTRRTGGPPPKKGRPINQGLCRWVIPPDQSAQRVRRFESARRLAETLPSDVLASHDEVAVDACDPHRDRVVCGVSGSEPNADQFPFGRRPRGLVDVPFSEGVGSLADDLYRIRRHDAAIRHDVGGRNAAQPPRANPCKWWLPQTRGVVSRATGRRIVPRSGVRGDPNE